MTNFISCSLTICEHVYEVRKIFWQHQIPNGVIVNVTLKLPQIHVIQDFSSPFSQQTKYYILQEVILCWGGCSM